MQRTWKSVPLRLVKEILGWPRSLRYSEPARDDSVQDVCGPRDRRCPADLRDNLLQRLNVDRLGEMVVDSCGEGTLLVFLAAVAGERYQDASTR